jgi:hypothetical protein
MRWGHGGSRRLLLVITIAALPSVTLIAVASALDTKSVRGTVTAPLGEGAAIGNGWRLRVLSVDWNATRKIAAVNSTGAGKPRHGRQDVMVLIELSYRNPGNRWLLRGFADRVQAWASASSHVGAYEWGLGVGTARNACGWGRAKLPPPDTIQPLVASDGSVHTGDKLRGHICFEIERRDIPALRLRVDGLPSPDPGKLGTPSVTFSLHMT